MRSLMRKQRPAHTTPIHENPIPGCPPPETCDIGTNNRTIEKAGRRRTKSFEDVRKDGPLRLSSQGRGPSGPQTRDGAVARKGRPAAHLRRACRTQSHRRPISAQVSAKSAPTIRIRTISIACTGTTTRHAPGSAAVPVHIELPEALTGVKARIVVAIGALFPMIRAHKVLAAYACLAPRLAAGRFDPQRQRAVWPSTGNYCRGGVAISRILGCRGVAVLPAGMSRERFDWLGAMGHGAGGHRAHARHRVQRQGNLRQVRRAGARSRQRDRQPVQRVRQLPGALALHRPGAGGDLPRPAEDIEGRAPRRLRLGQRLGRHARRRRLPQGSARHQDRRRRSRGMPDPAQQRLRRAQHPGHRRQARAADPQRHEHRPRDRHLGPGDRRPQRRVQHRGRARLPRPPPRPARRDRARVRPFRPVVDRQHPGRHQDGQARRARPRRCHRHRRHRRPRDVPQRAGALPASAATTSAT